MYVDVFFGSQNIWKNILQLWNLERNEPRPVVAIAAENIQDSSVQIYGNFHAVYQNWLQNGCFQ